LLLGEQVRHLRDVGGISPDEGDKKEQEEERFSLVQTCLLKLQEVEEVSP